MPVVCPQNQSWPCGCPAAQRFSTYYANCHQPIEQLKKAHFENRLPDKLKVLVKYKMLIIASAILDRVLHHCTVINIKGETYHLKARKEFMRQKQQIVNTLFVQRSA